MMSTPGHASLSGQGVPVRDHGDRIPILVVDDQPMNLDAIDAVLTPTGCRTVRALSADDALLALLEQDFAAIMLDIRMPGMNGIDLADLIKARPRSRHVPILFLTAHMFNERDILRGYGAGAVDYLTKPIHPEILRSKIGVFVELFRKTRDLALTNEALRKEMLERARAEDLLRLANQDLEERVRDRTRALERADRRKDEFLAVLGHELRNPLSPILSALEVMTPGVPAVDQTRASGVVRRQVLQMARLIDDLLDVGRITTDRFVLRTTNVPLGAVIAAAVETSRPAILERNHELALHGDLDGVMVNVDAARLSQVLSNLLTNAAKYTPAGGTIDLTTAVDEISGLTIRVKDSGVGIDEAVLPSLFELFVRLDPGGDTAGGGLGIGLALARRLVEMHGGTVNASSPGQNRGAEFTVWLPPTVIAPDESSAPIDEPVEHRPTSMRVLVVDDNVDAADMLTVMLSQWGYEARAASTGTEAVQTAEDFRPEVMLLDLGLPDLDGYQVAMQLRERDWTSGLKIYAVTGRGLEDDRRRSRESGLDDHLVKPIDPDALRRLLRRIQGNDGNDGNQGN
jgi:signal transduction histidine kinase